MAEGLIPDFANVPNVVTAGETAATVTRVKRKSRRGDDEATTGKYRAKNAELFALEIKADQNSSTKIYSRDYDNLYPLRIEKAINNSPTGRRCARMMASYIRGKGNAVNYLVGDGIRINDIIRESATDLTNQGGVFFKVKYGIDVDGSITELNFKPMIEVLDYVLMAVSKEDDNGRMGKFWVLKDDGEGGIKFGDDDITEWYYAYNKNPEVILYQMMNDCKLRGVENPSPEQLIKYYRGQVNYLNSTPKYKYALGVADSVYNDLDTEFRISVYNNVQTRKGFLGKTVVKMYDNGEDENDEFIDEVKDYLGAENSGNILVVEVPQDTEGDLKDAFVIDQLEAQFDDKMFESTVKNLRQNIMGAFNNIPEPLVFAASGSLFGTSADTYNEMKQFYWEQNQDFRDLLVNRLAEIGFVVEIQSLIAPTPKTDENGN